MSVPKTLEGLAPREAIADALYRLYVAYDTNDVELFRSAFPSDGDCAFVMGDQVTQGVDNIREGILNWIGPMDTTHLISSLRIDYRDGADKASLTASVIAQHGRPGQGQDPAAGRCLAGGMHLVDVIKEGSEWKVKKLELKLFWQHGDAGVMARS